MLRCVEGLNATIYYFKTTENLDDYIKFVAKMLKSSRSVINFLVYDSSEGKLSDKFEKSINQLWIDHLMELINIDIKNTGTKDDTAFTGMLGEWFLFSPWF